MLWNAVYTAMSSLPQLYANQQNVAAQDRTNEANVQIAREANNFSREMSNTAHTREVQDLKRAGLNPILSAGGNGSSTPTGQTATMQAPKIEMPDIMSYGISLKQLEQADQRLAIDKANSAAGIAKTLDERELLKMKKILAQKGMPRAEMEGEASLVLRKMLKFLKDGVRRQQSPGQRNYNYDPATDNHFQKP